MRMAALIFLLALTACGGDGGGGYVPPPPPPTISMAATSWVFSTGNPGRVNPTQNGSGWSFDFPVWSPAPPTQINQCVALICPRIGYIQTATSIPLVGKSITINTEITTTGNPVFQYQLNTDNVCVNPAQVVLLISGPSDNRWFSRWPGIELKAGSGTLTVPFTADRWVSAYGYGPQYFPTSVVYVGIVFGGGCFSGHGVNISDGGTAMFTLKSYEVK